MLLQLRAFAQGIEVRPENAYTRHAGRTGEEKAQLPRDLHVCRSDPSFRPDCVRTPPTI